MAEFTPESVAEGAPPNTSGWSRAVSPPPRLSRATGAPTSIGNQKSAMIRLRSIISLGIWSLVLNACIQTSQSNGGALLPDGKPRYEKLSPRESKLYEVVCRGAFERWSIRHDVQIKGPVIYRDLATRQIVGIYHLGFIARFVIRFDAGIKQGVTEAYFEDYDTNKRIADVPRLLRPAEHAVGGNRR